MWLHGIAVALAVIGATSCNPDPPKEAVVIVFDIEPSNRLPWRTVEKVHQRIGARGIVEPSVTRIGSKLVVRMPGLDEDLRETVVDLLTRDAHWTIHRVDPAAAWMERLTARVASDPVARGLEIRVERDARGAYLAADDRLAFLPVAEAEQLGCWFDGRETIAGTVECGVTGRHVIETYVADVALLEPGAVLGFERVYQRPGDISERTWRTHALVSEALLRDADLEWAETVYGSPVGPVAHVTWSPGAEQRFADVASPSAGALEHLAILMDGRATIVEPIRAGDFAGLRYAGALPATGSSEQRERNAFFATEDVVAILNAGIPMGIRPSAAQ